MFRAVAALALLALAGGCVYPEQEEEDALGGHGLPDLAADRPQPRLALMDHVLAEYFASDLGNRPTVCASVTDGRSEVALPPEQEQALIARYEALAPFSRCGWIDNAWRDIETGEPAIVFSIHSFTCPDEERCSAFAGYTAGQTNSMSYRYSMQWTGAEWSFERSPRIIADQ